MAKRILIDWRPRFDQSVRARGMDYHLKNRVRNIIRKGQVISGEVIGEAGVHYLVTVGLADNSNSVIYENCTCEEAREGKRCRHEAALLYELENNLAEALDEIENEIAEIAVSENVSETDLMGGEGYKINDNGIVVYDPPDKGQTPVSAVDEIMSYRYYDYPAILESAEIEPSTWKKGVLLAGNGDITITDVSFQSATGMLSYLQKDPNSSPHDKYAVIEGRLRNSQYKVNITMGPCRMIFHNCMVLGCRGNGFKYVKELCEHEAALLYLFKDYLDNNGVEVDATDEMAAGLMRAIAYDKGLPDTEWDGAAESDGLDIVPELSLTGSGELAAVFYLYTPRKYKISKLNEFYLAVKNNRPMKFGPTVIRLGRGLLGAHGRVVYDFLDNLAEENRGARIHGSFRTSSYSSLMYNRMDENVDLFGYKDEVFLYGHYLDSFYDICEGYSIAAHGFDAEEPGKGKRQLEMGNEMVSPVINIERMQGSDDKPVGIRISGRIPHVFKGEKYSYIVAGGKLNRISSHDARTIEPLQRAAKGGLLDISVGMRNLSRFYYYTLPELTERATVNVKDEDWINNYLLPKASFCFYLDREKGYVTCKAEYSYGDYTGTLFAGSMNSEGFRDTGIENEVLQLLGRFFPDKDEDNELFICNEKKNEELVYDLLSYGLDEMQALGQVRHTDSFLALNIRKNAKLRVGVSISSNLLDLELSADDISPDELMAILDSYRKKKRYYRLKNGDFIRLEGESIETLGRIMDDLHLDLRSFVEGKMQIPAYRALYLDRMLEEGSGMYEHRDRHFKKLIQEFKTIRDAEFDLPAGLKGQLRSYQEEGYQWIRTLGKYGFGGVLADEMGLGKTIQAITVLEALREEGEAGTSLIVVPASLVYNWGEEIRRFAPGLNCILITGNKTERRGKIRDIEHYDVAVTSYDLIKRDIAEYEDHSFNVQIIDEAQYIKNHLSQAAKSVKLIKADCKLALTGTPIENRLSELWSIFDYLMPGILYSYNYFRDKYEMPIVRDEQTDAMERLRSMVAPFILRRKKKDVLKDLPDKLEEIRYAQMDEDQRKLYDAQVYYMKARLEGQSEEDYTKSKIEVLSELTRIRQICCNPALCFEKYRGSSAKTDLCMDLIGQAIEGEHKILVFSQFVSMLDILKKRLDNEGIKYYVITGSTPKEHRLELVKAFNKGVVPVFLISLKAGGTGLNLTGADVVIHYDPWWNLAAQNQATDRAHRIGQKNPVTVFRLIASDTVEDKILELQEKKKALAEDILESEGVASSSLSRDDLLNLLE
ncbi:DEAD/DEAH box helicase [Butyrivibrio sp. MC2013]|uniref:DEAD/DEAH box helicase n=1 Tax=Butyrivibrio sp. MC2013 TaxID=1280686 RepID=UPI0003F88C75|nr:DEAD/DEAH box helicase [Butyrivibrio sp. MC2013]